MSYCALIYYIIGIILTLYWFVKKYRNNINNNIIKNEYPIFSFLMLCLIFFWPLKIIWNLLKKFKNISKF